jgi:hypothetical protein
MGGGGHNPNGPMVNSPAAELMNLAARKMAMKEEERMAMYQQRSQHVHTIPINDLNMDQEEYDQFALPKLRARSKSISSYDPMVQKIRENSGYYPEEPSTLSSIWNRGQSGQYSSMNASQGYPGHHLSQASTSVPGSTGISGNSSGASSPAGLMPHRRSSTFTYSTPWGPSNGNADINASPASQGLLHSHHHLMNAHHSLPASTFNSLPGSPDRFDRLRSQRRFSVSPTVSSGDYDQIAAAQMSSMRQLPMDHMSPRRHSVAGPLGYHAPGRYLSEAFSGVNLNDSESEMSSATYGHLLNDVDGYFDQGVTPGMSSPMSMSSGNPGAPFSEVGRGIPLHQLPSNTCLYIVEFKAGRSDIFFIGDAAVQLGKGDLVIVEADRGKDLGKVINNNITPHQIHMLQAQQSDVLNELHRINREIHPKRVYRLAQPQEVAMLVTKAQDEAKAMAVCQTKVRQKKLPMEVVDAEYQWDRRKLTFYFLAERRIDFRELVRDLFKIYKTRIWMCAVNAITKAPQFPSPTPSLTTLPSSGMEPGAYGNDAMGGNQMSNHGMDHGDYSNHQQYSPTGSSHSRGSPISATPPGKHSSP